jgi:hypothetical protein
VGRSLRYLGFLVLAALLGVWMAADVLKWTAVQEHLTPALFMQVAALAGFMIAAGFVLPLLGGAAGVVVGKRCARCSKRIDSAATYCKDHQKVALEELRDKDRWHDQTNSRRRPGR